MKRLLYVLVLFIQVLTAQTNNVGIHTTSPDPSAMLDVTSTVGGILIPRMLETERIAIVSPATGLLVYQTNNTSGFWFFDGVNWTLLGNGSGWEKSGNTGTSATTNFIGTIDNQDFVVRTNNLEALRLDTNGNLGIGTNVPSAKLHINNVSGGSTLRIVTGGEDTGKVLKSDANGIASWENTSVLLPQVMKIGCS